MSLHRTGAGSKATLRDAALRPATRWRKVRRAWRLAKRRDRLGIVVLLACAVASFVASLAQHHVPIATIALLAAAGMEIAGTTRDGMQAIVSRWRSKRRTR